MRDARDVLFYDGLRSFLRKQYKAERITKDEITSAVNILETTDGGGVYEFIFFTYSLGLIFEGFNCFNRPPSPCCDIFGEVFRNCSA